MRRRHKISAYQKGKKNMNEKIRKHINELFKDAPKTRRAMELKEEMAVNTIEKYEDLIGEGYLPEKERKKKAMLTAAAVGIYIFAGVVLIVSLVINDLFFGGAETGILGLALAVLICIPPTCMLVYAANMYPVHNRKEENLVELYKEAATSGSREKAVRQSVSVIIWLVTLLLYFAISMKTRRWEITWLVFLVGACAQMIEVLIFNLKHMGS